MVEEEIVRIYIKEVYFSVCKLCDRHIGVILDSPKDRLNDFWSPKRVGEDIDAKLKKNLGGSNKHRSCACDMRACTDNKLIFEYVSDLEFVLSFRKIAT